MLNKTIKYQLVLYIKYWYFPLISSNFLKQRIKCNYYRMIKIIQDGNIIVIIASIILNYQSQRTYLIL